MKVLSTMMLLLALSVMGSVAAQGCPQGIPQGAPGCVPPNHPNLPGNAQGPAQAPVHARWKKTWGAIASDRDSPWIGTSTGHANQRAAVREAVGKCEAKGGRACEVRLTYENQCVVIAEPEGEDGPMRIVYRSGPTIENARAQALPDCATENGGRRCALLYSNCTTPVLVK